MRLIRGVTINYFRSVHRSRLKDLTDLVVISGRNDVGKSTVLKALNLFFNQKTDWQEPLDFYRDFSLQRLEQVRRESVKGRQYISVEVEFYRPPTYKGSLPPTFSVRRIWYRDGGQYGETNNLEKPAVRSQIPAKKIETAQRFLSLFLNKVHYEYVPAVKDRHYFAHLLSRLQATLLRVETGADEVISQTAENLAGHIQARVVALQDDFSRATGIRSTVVPPAELAGLFQAFTVSTETQGHKVALSLRGDGIQARYVPSVLRYISEASNDFFIWGFEEPENSLEYAYAVKMAQDMESVYTKAAQVFVTSHCPAFVGLRTENTTVVRALRPSVNTELITVHPATERGSLDSHELNVELGTTALEEVAARAYTRLVAEARSVQDSLRAAQEEAARLQRPILFVEGKHDVTILTLAWAKLYPNVALPFIIRNADTAGGLEGGTGGAPTLRTIIEAVHPDEGRSCLALFDRDVEGLRNLRALSNNFGDEVGPNLLRSHRNRLAKAMVLPIPPRREDYAQAENLPLEYYFADDVINTKTPDGRGLVLVTPPVHIQVGARKVQITDPPEGLNLAVYQKVQAGKDVFAGEVLPAIAADHYENFAPLFDSVRTHLGLSGAA